MATYGKKQGWQCHEILNQCERMNNSEKKGRGKYNYDLTREQLLAYSAGKCCDKT